MAPRGSKKTGEEPSTSSGANPQGEPEELTAESVTGVATVPDVPKPEGDPLASVGDAMPKPQPHAIAAAQAQTAEQEQAVVPPAGGIPPANPAEKEAFDPAIHEVDSVTGKPRLTKDGGFRRKRGNGGRKLNTSGVQKPGGASAGATVAPMIDETKLANAAANSAALLFGLGQLIGGEEWAPMKKRINADLEIDERGQMTGAFQDYYRSRGIVDIPPGICLCIVIVSYASARWHMPKTKTRWERLKLWFQINVLKSRAKAAAKRDSAGDSADGAKEAESVDVR